MVMVITEENRISIGENLSEFLSTNYLSQERGNLLELLKDGKITVDKIPPHATTKVLVEIEIPLEGLAC